MYTYLPRSNPPAFIRKKADQPFTGYGDDSPSNIPGSPDAFNPSIVALDQTKAWLYRSLNANAPLPRPLTKSAVEQRLLTLYDQAKATTARLKIEDIRVALSKPSLTTRPNANTEAKDRMEYLFSSALPEQLHINPDNPQEVGYYLQFVTRILDLAKTINAPPRRPQLNLPNNMRSKL